MTIVTDFAIDSAGAIYYTGAVHGAAGAGYYTVIQLHRQLQDLADDASAIGDDLIDITSETPSDRSTDNIITIKTGYTLDDSHPSATDPISEHLYDGSIIQEADGKTWDGLAVIASEGMDLQIMQNGALIANDFWNTVPNGETLKGLNRDVANGLSHRFMLEVHNGTADIDGRRLIGMTRAIGKTYSEFKINGTSNGNNVLALTYADDLNDTTSAAARGTIDNQTYGYVGLDIDGNTTNEFYYSEWNKDTYTINQFYERMKWLTACESGTTDATPNSSAHYGMDANIFRGITHEVAGSQLAGTFGTANGFDDYTAGGQPEPVSWATGTGQMLAIDHVTAGTKMWIQILTGTAPVNTEVITGGSSSATFTASGSTEKTITTPFIGQSTGSALIGAYGIGMETPSDVSSSDLFTDLDGNTNQPPNNVTFTVQGLVSGEDRVLVGPENGSSGLRADQCEVNTSEAITVTAGSVSSATAGAGEVVLKSNTETIGTSQPSAIDTPAAGTIRVIDANGIYQIINYTSYTAGSGTIQFSGCTATGTWSAAALNDAFISYIDELASGTTATYTVVFDSSRTLFIRVRDGGTAGDAQGIKTFETTGTLGSAGGSTTAIRTSDV